MKTAVIYAGQARSFGETFPNHFFHLLRKLPDPEFFVSVADDAQAPSMSRLLERFDESKVHIETVKQPDLPEPLPDPKWLGMYPAASSPQSILKMFWARQRAWEMYLACTGEVRHELVVFVRPDIAFARCDLPDNLPDRLQWAKDSCHTPWWARWGGCNDRMAVMGPKAAQSYFTVCRRVEELREMGCPLHPETLLAAALELGGIEPQHTLATEFVTIRLDGSTVACSMSAVEYAEYARSH